MRQFDEIGDLNDPSRLGRERSESSGLLGEDQSASGADDLTLGGGEGKARRRSGVIIFAVVSAATFASIWSMRAIGRANASAMTNSESSRLVDSYLGERAKQRTTPANAPSASAPLPVGDTGDLQIARERLARDPFAPPSRELVIATDAGSTDPSQPEPEVDEAVALERERELQIETWRQSVDAGAHDFVVVSVLVASDPAMSIVSMNGDVFRVGESVMFPDHGIAYEIVSVTMAGITFRAANEELGCEQMVELIFVQQP